MTPDHNDEGEWDPMLLNIILGCLAAPVVWLIAKVVFWKGVS